jgi:NAD(P)-dependent dehydrogenase (short-subunit alcohol dehydrogenase family)
MRVGGERAEPAEQVDAVATEIGGLGASRRRVASRGRRALGQGKSSASSAPSSFSAPTPESGNPTARRGRSPVEAVVARPRGQCARRPSRVPGRHPLDARARVRADRDHRERSRVPPGIRRTAYPTSKAAVCRYGEALAESSRARSRVLLQPGLVRTDMTECRSATTRRGRRPSSHRGSSGFSPRGARTRSPAATSTPSTTTSRSWCHEPTRSSRATSKQSGLALTS